MEVSIIIVNYHSDELLREAIISIREKTVGVKYEILVVDSDPCGYTEAMLESIAGDISIRYIPMAENRGFGAANNEGFRFARGKYLFCLNPDTLLVNNAVRILADYIDNHPECGACGGNLFHKDMSPALSFRRILPGPFWEISEKYRRHPERLLYGRNTKFNHSCRPLNVGYITGADLMLRKSLIDKIGGFDPDFFMYFEETDLCSRIHNAGFTVMSVPQAKIIHLEGQTIGTQALNRRKLEYYEQSRVLYYNKNLTPEKAAKALQIHIKKLIKSSSKPGIAGEEARLQLELCRKFSGISTV